MYDENTTPPFLSIMTKTLVTIQKIITAPLLAFALMAPMPKNYQSEKVFQYQFEGSFQSLKTTSLATKDILVTAYGF